MCEISKTDIDMKKIHNSSLEKIRGKINDKTIPEILQFFEEEFYDVISMLEDIERIFSINKTQISKIWVGYLDPYPISSHEHENIHCYDSEFPNDYIKTIPPIIRVWNARIGVFLGNDGNHRINTCEMMGMKVPCIILEVK